MRKVWLLLPLLLSTAATVRAQESTTLYACSGTNDTTLLSAAVLVGNPIVIPAGVTCATNNITINVPLYVSYSGRLKPNTGQTATLTSGIWAGGDTPWQAFANATAGLGTVSLSSVIEASPVWWGGDNTGVIDSAAAINAAQASGAKTINMQGSWGLRSPIFITGGLTNFDGKTRLASRVYALQADISTGGSPNALFIVRVRPWNGSLKSLRFPNSGAMWTGWVISADENGPGNEASLFSAHVHDLWVDPGSLAAGFFRGGAHNSWFHHIQFESCRHRFLLLGTSVTDSVIIDDIDDYACFFPFLEAISSTQPEFARVTLSNITVTAHQNDYWIKTKNMVDLTVSNVHYLMNDGGTGQTAGFASIENGTNILISNFNVRRQAGTSFTGFKLIGTQAKIHGGYLKGVNGSFALRIEGNGNDIDLTDIRIEGPEAAGYAIDGTSGIGGNLRVSNCIFTGSGQYIVNLAGSVDATFSNCELLNGNYGFSPSVPLILINSSGWMVFQNNTIGVNDAGATPTYAFTASGSGQWWMFNNRVIGLSASQLLSPATTQVPKLRGNFYTDTGTFEWLRKGVGSPIGSFTPAFLGEEYLDTGAGRWYKASGLTNADWKALN